MKTWGNSGSLGKSSPTLPCTTFLSRPASSISCGSSKTMSQTDIGYDPILGSFPVFSKAAVLDELRKLPGSPDQPKEPIQGSGFAVGQVIPYPAPDAPAEDEFDPEIREVSSVVWAKIKKAMAERKAKGESSPFRESKER